MQTTNSVFMIRSALFFRNEDTASSNYFQRDSHTLDKGYIQQKALVGFNYYVAALRQSGIQVVVIDDVVETQTPNSLFPNNWITTHANGDIILYPMATPNRRRERNPAVIS